MLVSATSVVSVVLLLGSSVNALPGKNDTIQILPYEDKFIVPHSEYEISPAAEQPEIPIDASYWPPRYKCPSGYYKTCGKKVFVTAYKGSYDFGKYICRKCGGELVNIFGSEQFRCLARFLAVFGYQEPVYVGSWNGDDYQEAGIALFPASKFGAGAIAIPREGKEGPYFSFCEVS